MTDYELTTMLRELDQPEPPFPPGHLEQTVALARAKARRHRFGQAATAVAMTMLLGVAGIVLPGQIISGGGAASASVVLPDHVAGYHLLNADVTADPAGPALMLLQSGSSRTFTTEQMVLMHADGQSYRKVEALRGKDGTFNRQALLSPEGDALLFAERNKETTAFTYLDLNTGESRVLPLLEPIGVMLHAWSPDGRTVAYAQVAWGGREDVTPDALEHAIRDRGVLTILDLRTGRSTPYLDVAPASAASFGPGGDQLAVQVGEQILVLNLPDGRRRQLGIRLPEPGLGIAPGVSWSPDGRWLALIAWRVYESGAEGKSVLLPMSGPWTPAYGKLTFVDATGAGRIAPDPVQAGEMLGWRTPQSLLALDYHTGKLSEIALDKLEVKTLSTVERPRSCELWTRLCTFSNIQVATGLLSSAVVEPAESPLRGPWPGWLQLAAIVVLVVVGFVFFRLVRRFTSGHSDAFQ